MAETPQPKKRGGKDASAKSSPRKRKLEDMQQQARASLTCGVCWELIPPPIQQCSEGHPICDGCFARIKNRHNAKICPTCRTAFPAKRLRNLIADQMAQLIDYPCPYEAHGCNATMPPDELSKHMQDCKHNPHNVSCPMRDCTWHGPSSAFEAHVQEAASQNYLNMENPDLRSRESRCWIEHSNAYNLMSHATVRTDRITGSRQLWLDGMMERSPFRHDVPQLIFFKDAIFMACADLQANPSSGSQDAEAHKVINIGFFRLTTPETVDQLSVKVSVHDGMMDSGISSWGPASKIATSREDVPKNPTTMSIDVSKGRLMSVRKTSCFDHPSDVLSVTYSIIERPRDLQES